MTMIRRDGRGGRASLFCCCLYWYYVACYCCYSLEILLRLRAAGGSGCVANPGGGGDTFPEMPIVDDPGTGCIP